MLGRLAGQETEYAIRFTPERRHPGNDVIYEAIAGAIRARVRTAPGLSSSWSQRVFSENGGAFSYEFLPYCAWGGLLEGATPECRGPAQLLLYQRAQESLLLGAVPAAEERLRAMGYPGKIGLLKNCRDAHGNVYGAQESFEAPIARGAGLWLYRAGLALLLPLVFVSMALGWLLFAVLALALVVPAVLAAVGLAVSPSRARRLVERWIAEDRRLESTRRRFLYSMDYALGWPLVASFSCLIAAFAFRRIRRDATAFLVSRCVLTGSGSVDASGRLVLSEKAGAMTTSIRRAPGQHSRAIFDTANLIKPTFALAHLHPSALPTLFRRTQRLQLGLADSNVLDEAEFLKMGVTALVIDMVEDGWLEDAPRLRRPIEALHAISADPTLQVEVETLGGGGMTGLHIQRFFLDRAKVYLAERPAASLEGRAVVELWEEVVSLLERKRFDQLVGRLDWITKRYLLEACGQGEDARFLKTIDLRYHELGEGYAARLAREGMVRRLVSPFEIQRAVVEPPEDTPAFTRGRVIRGHDPALGPLRIAWDSAWVGGRFRGELVRFPGAGAVH